MFARTLSAGASVTAALMLLACRSDKPSVSLAGSADSLHITPASSQTTTAAPDAASNVVNVTASDYAFEAPAEVPAGLVTFRLENRGPSIHHVQLLKLEDGKTAKDFADALKAGGPPRWAVPAGGPNPPELGQSSSAQVTLTPGQYVMVCFVPTSEGVPHLMKGMVRPLTVTAGSAASAAEPTADVVMKLVDFDFQLSRPLTAGRQMLRIENAGNQPHEVAIVLMDPGKDPMTFATWGMHQKGPAPGKLYGGVSAIMPGTHAYVPVDLPPGEYGLICFDPDMKDGKPHFMHGMAKKVKIG